MILICGIPSEDPVRLVIEAAARRRVPHVVLNQRQVHHHALHLAAGNAKGVTGTLMIGDSAYPLDSFTGVYNRLIEHESIPENRPGRLRAPDPVETARAASFLQMLHAWLEIAPARVLNRNGPMATNVSKPYQSQIIRRAGFDIPPTLVTNDPAEVRDFAARHGRLIYKSVSSIRSIVKTLDPADRRLDKVRALPTQFQAFIPGENIRVHVAGPRLFATRILSDATDYRYAGRDGIEVRMEPLRLPPRIAGRCRRLSRDLDLPLCGIDLKRTPDGRWVCFEANPSPAFSYYQGHTGQDIAGAIVAHLQ